MQSRCIQYGYKVSKNRFYLLSKIGMQLRNLGKSTNLIKSIFIQSFTFVALNISKIFLKVNFSEF